jgi:hypothetical protein
MMEIGVRQRRTEATEPGELARINHWCAVKGI